MWADADWNTRWPFGTSCCVRLGRARGEDHQRNGPGFTLDVNPPLGEPNRLYLWLAGRGLVIGLPTIRGSRDTGEQRNGIPVFAECRTWPRIERPFLIRRRRQDDSETSARARTRGREEGQVPPP